MAKLIIALLLQITLSNSQPQSYGDAYRDAKANNRPLVVVVGAEWCPACVVLKQQTIPSVAANGSLDDAAYTFVDVDTQRELASKILVGDQIPQIVRYSWDDDGVHVERLNGAPSADEVSRFVQGQTSVASLE